MLYLNTYLFWFPLDSTGIFLYHRYNFKQCDDEEGEKLPLQRAAGRCKAVQIVFQSRRFRAGVQKTQVSRASREPA